MKCPHQDLDAVEDLTARIVAAPPWSPPVPDWRAKIVMASDLQAMTFTPVRHIVPGYISEGATIIAGKPKVGKSWMTLDLGLAATADRFTGALRRRHFRHGISSTPCAGFSVGRMTPRWSRPIQRWA
jgi:hypothetical protein